MTCGLLAPVGPTRSSCSAARTAFTVTLLLLLAALPSARAQNPVGAFSGGGVSFDLATTTIHPGVVTICVASYPPFMMFEQGCAGPCAFNNLAVPSTNNSVVNPNPLNGQKNWFAQDAPGLTGFDHDFIELIFNRMLSLPFQYHAFNSLTEMNFGLLSGKCDVAITASQMDPATQFCPDGAANTSGAMLYDYGYGDYGAGVGPFGSDGIVTQVKCLQYGAPYVTSGFALASIPVATAFDVTSAVFNPDVANAACVVLIIGMTCGYVVMMLEKTNRNLGTPSRGAYWALMTFLLVSEEHPRMKPGRVIMVVFMLANIVSLCIITSIISAKLTTTSLSVTYIQQFRDIPGPLCVESNYAVLMEYVQRQTAKPSVIVSDTLDGCWTQLRAGNVSAMITDATVLSWYSSYYSIPGAYISPVLQSNPFAFVYANSSNGLMAYVNPAVVAATLADSSWIPITQSIFTKYFGKSTGVISPFVSQVNRAPFIAAMVLAAFPLCFAFLNGDWGRGLFKDAPEGSWRYRFRKFVAQPTNAGITDRDAALMGDELSQVRFYASQFDFMRAHLLQLDNHLGLDPLIHERDDKPKNKMLLPADESEKGTDGAEQSAAAVELYDEEDGGGATEAKTLTRTPSLFEKQQAEQAAALAAALEPVLA